MQPMLAITPSLIADWTFRDAIKGLEELEGCAVSLACITEE